MKPNLYICHTAYQVLVDLLRASRTDGQPHTMVLSAAVPEPQSLAKKLEATGAVKVVIVDETRWPGTVTGPFAARRARRAFEKLCGWRFTRAAYNEVRIHNDWSVLGRYLQDCHAGYILCEDTFASTLGPDQHLVTDQRAAPDFAGKQRTGKGYLYWGDSPWCAKVESEDAAKCTLFPASRLVTDSKRELLEGLTDAEKAMVRSVFLTQPLPENAAGATLLLPRSFVEDGLMTQAEQNAMFKAAAVHQDPPAGHHRLPRPVPRRGDLRAHDAQRSAELLPSLQIRPRRHGPKLRPPRLHRRRRKNSPNPRRSESAYIAPNCRGEHCSPAGRCKHRPLQSLRYP